MGRCSCMTIKYVLLKLMKLNKVLWVLSRILCSSIQVTIDDLWEFPVMLGMPHKRFNSWCSTKIDAFTNKAYRHCIFI